MLPINIRFLKLFNYEGIYFFVAIISGLIYFIYTCKKDNINLDVMFEGVLYSFIAAIICGRVLSFVLWNPKALIENPLVLINIFKGLSGFTVTGAVLGGIVTGYVYARIKKIHFFYHMKYVIPSILIGQVIGRFGCFLNGDASGIPTTLPWGIVFPPHSIAYMGMMIKGPDLPALHPTQFYEMAGNFILLSFMIFTGNNEWFTKRRLAFYAMGYGFIRFIVEFFRGDSVKFFNVFTTGQLISFVGIIIGVIILVWSVLNKDKMEVNPENIAYKK